MAGKGTGSKSIALRTKVLSAIDLHGHRVRSARAMRAITIGEVVVTQEVIVRPVCQEEAVREEVAAASEEEVVDGDADELFDRPFNSNSRDH